MTTLTLTDAQRRIRNAVAGFVAPAGLVLAGVAAPAGAQVPSPAPDSSGPGFSLLTKVLGWTLYGALVACVIAVVAGGALWGFGQSSGGIGGREGQGKQMVLGGAIGAAICGVAVAGVNGVFSAAN